MENGCCKPLVAAPESLDTQCVIEGPPCLSFAATRKTILPELVRDVQAQGVFWNRCYEPWRIARDTIIKDRLLGDSVPVKSYNGSVLFEPPNTTKPDGTPYRVFTPFYRKGCLQNGIPPRQPLPAPHDIPLYEADAGLSLDELELMPNINWYTEMSEMWSPGEDGAAQEGWRHFCRRGSAITTKVAIARTSNTCRGSRRICTSARFHRTRCGLPCTKGVRTEELTPDADRFLSELGWREFSNNLLYNEPTITTDNLQRKFDRFPWRDDDESLQRWQHGTTGYPIVDAGMRELWRTGYMHNRVRMIVGSFLVKNLLQHWHHGAKWFWDTLVDADLANNSASWQWIAGCGADAAPYFRIFNPVTQGKKFDPEGRYVRHYVPELSAMPDKFIHNPWEAPQEILLEAGVEIGGDYPAPVVDLKTSRERALAAFKSLSPAAT